MEAQNQNQTQKNEKQNRTSSEAMASGNQESIGMLNGLVADHFVLLMKSFNYHWNVEGMEFHEIHKLLETHYEETVMNIDELAERVRALGGRPMATLREIVDNTRLKEAQAGGSANQMLQDLLQDHENIISMLKEGIDQCDNEFNDYGSSDLLTGLLRKHEKTAWMLRASIQQ